jgi:hypothetical protein
MSVHDGNPKIDGPALGALMLFTTHSTDRALAGWVPDEALDLEASTQREVAVFIAE